ncbi:hypothetical protein [Xanthomonas sp. SS]|uniref:hypothetical protein n=1 Tax=Xanthomonas sp. SS TaxID=2724122 RepID=UPI00163A3B06|nr:hypothetical protein [Xanthomonas sp. SS]
METLAEVAFEYIWLILFENEDVIDLDYSVRCQECLPTFFGAMTPEERSALSEVARQRKDRLLAPPDKHGYTPRSLVTEEQKQFLNDVISGAIYDFGSE